MSVSRFMSQESVAERDPRLQTREITPDLLAYIVEKIVRAIAPQRIILFGSRSRGQETESSDLDLFVIQDTGRPSRQVRREIDQLLWGRRFAVDLIVATPEQVERNVAGGNPFYTRHILAEGKVLYDRMSGQTENHRDRNQLKTSPKFRGDAKKIGAAQRGLRPALFCFVISPLRCRWPVPTMGSWSRG
jgi:predicted nucleotidyltransferase